MKKVISLLISFILVAMTVVTASAAGVAKFNVNLISETDKEAVISFDFEGGTGFSALDFEITINSEKVKVQEVEKGNGYNNFANQVGTAFALVNKEITPIKASVVTLNGFRVVDGKDLFVITLKKLSKEALASDDVVFEITNCVDQNQDEITPSITTDLQGTASSDGASTSVALIPSSAVSVTQPSSADISQKDEEPVFTNGVEPDGTEFDAEIGAEENLEGGENEKTSNSKKIAAVVAAALVMVVVIAAVVIYVVKKTKTNEENGNEE